MLLFPLLRAEQIAGKAPAPLYPPQSVVAHREKSEAIIIARIKMSDLHTSAVTAFDSGIGKDEAIRRNGIHALGACARQGDGDRRRRHQYQNAVA